MASNNDVVVYAFDGSSGAPLAGLTPTWASLRNVADGTDQSGSAPAISEIAGGMYKFTRPTGGGLGVMHLAGIIDFGASANPRYQPIDIRPEEAIDAVDLLGTPAGASVSADIAAVKAKTDFIPTDFDDMVARMLGLMHENSVLDNTSFDSLNNMTAGRIRIYDSKANAQAAGATGLLATYSITATYVGGNLATYTVVKE